MATAWLALLLGGGRGGVGEGKESALLSIHPVTRLQGAAGLSPPQPCPGHSEVGKKNHFGGCLHYCCCYLFVLNVIYCQKRCRIPDPPLPIFPKCWGTGVSHHAKCIGLCGSGGLQQKPHNTPPDEQHPQIL